MHESLVDGEIVKLGTQGMDLRYAHGDDLVQRKQMLMEEADCFICMPGGTGDPI